MAFMMKFREAKSQKRGGLDWLRKIPFSPIMRPEQPVGRASRLPRARCIHCARVTAYSEVVHLTA
jgi:hypothetical protein